MRQHGDYVRHVTQGRVARPKRRKVQTQEHRLVHQRKTNQLRKHLHRLHVFGKTPTKVKPQPSCRVIHATNGIISNTARVKILAHTNQANCPWLTHACVTTMQPVFALLGNISSNFDYQEFLKAVIVYHVTSMQKSCAS